MKTVLITYNYLKLKLVDIVFLVILDSSDQLCNFKVCDYDLFVYTIKPEIPICVVKVQKFELSK